MKHRTPHLVAAVATSLVLASTSVTLAGDNYWSGGSAFSANWSDSLNWRNVDGPGTTERQGAWFEGASARTTSTVNQDYELDALYFSYDTLGVESNFTVNRSNNARLRVHVGVANYASKSQTVNVPVIFLEGGAIQNHFDSLDGGRLYVGDVGTNGQSVRIKPAMSGIILNGGIYDAGSITVDGPGTVSPNAQSYWTGGLYLKNGAVSYYASNQLGPDANAIHFNNDNGTYSLLSSYVSLTNAHPIAFEANEGRISTDVGNDTTFSGALSGGGAIAKFGPGILTFTGASTRTGSTYVREGTLKIGGSSTLPDTLLDVSANATLAYVGTVNDRVGSLSGAGAVQLGTGGVWGVGNPGDSTAAGNGGGTFSGSISGANVTLNKQGTGTLNLTGDNAISGYLDMYGGKLLLNNSGATAAAGTSQITVVAGTVGGDGSTNGAIDVYAGSVVEPSSSVVPGFGLGSLSAGIVALRPGSTAKIEVGAGGADSLSSLSSIDLYGGTLALSTVLNQPIGDTTRRTILHAAGALSGTFGTVGGIAMSNGRSLAVTYDAHNVYVTGARPGDATLDGRVNFDDLLLVSQNYGAAAGKTWSIGDFTGDGLANFDDLLVLAQNYGFGSLVGDHASIPRLTELGAGFAADWTLAQSFVPEPTSLATIGLATLALRRRSRRR